MISARKSLVDEQGKAQDGFLRANDIYNLRLPAELVGLTRGFMYAGAARVINCSGLDVETEAMALALLWEVCPEIKGYQA